jgi:hypothetical protein
MPEIQIVVDDVAVRNLLARTNDRIDAAIRLSMDDATKLLLREVKTYPATRPGQRYTRTRTLAKSWDKEITDSGLETIGRVYSNGANMVTRSGLPYSRYVQDRDYQAYMHVGRWSTVQDIAERNTEQIQAMFANRIRAATGG